MNKPTMDQVLWGLLLGSIIAMAVFIGQSLTQPVRVLEVRTYMVQSKEVQTRTQFDVTTWLTLGIYTSKTVTDYMIFLNGTSIENERLFNQLEPGDRLFFVIYERGHIRWSEWTRTPFFSGSFSQGG